MRRASFGSYRMLAGLVLLWLALAAAAFGQNACAAVPQIAAGYYHSAAVKSDGTVWAWGSNGFGQLGTGTLAQSALPVRVPGIEGVRAIAAGFFHTAALKSDGTVWTWGDNSLSQLGIGDDSVAMSAAPRQVPGLAGVVAIAASGAHNLALKGDGTVWVWGWNGYGQLGIGNTADAGLPRQIVMLPPVAGIAAGFFHTIVRDADGRVWSWGYNGHGQLGDGTRNQSEWPHPVSGLSGIVALAAGGGHTLAVKNDGTLWAWGWNNHGQLGNGGNVDSDIPVQAGASAVKAVAAGFFHSAALLNGGAVHAWGDGSSGQLGSGALADAAVPAPVAGMGGIVAIAANNSQTFALHNDGTGYGWGANEYGQLGSGVPADAAVPAAVAGPVPGQRFDLGVSSYQDVWNDPAEPGWGVTIVQHGAMLFASWHTYDAAGNAIWLVIPGGAWTSPTTFGGAMYSTSAQAGGIPYTPGTVTLTPVGNAEFRFGDVNHATFAFTYGGMSGSRALTRYVFDASQNPRSLDYSDIWWVPSESGWGITITQQFQTLFANWRTYDQDGRPIRFLMPGGGWIDSSTYRGLLYRTASTPTGHALTLGTLSTVAVGSMTISFVDADNAVFRYELGGMTGSKYVTRLKF